jgi:glutamate formiminotransferase / 5-formyltetrahydrofolate cyclo-ligase
VFNGSPFAECVINISEGRDQQIVEAISEAAGVAMLDVHSDPDHHRSVLTIGGPLDVVEDAARRLTTVAVATIDLRSHAGVHPRLGSVDVVPFVPLPQTVVSGPAGPLRPDVLAARVRFAEWAGDQLAVPCFLYGPQRSLPDVRRLAFRPLEPDAGPRQPHPTAGATAVGARPVLVAYNVWIAGDDNRGGVGDPDHALSVARSLAVELRNPSVRALGLPTRAGAQVSFNLLDPGSVSPAHLYDAVAVGAESHHCSVLRAELVGLLPAGTLEQVPRHRWPELDLAAERTIESRMEATWHPPSGGG